MASEIPRLYVTPQLTIYGDIQKITQQGGGDSTDIPQGTPVASDATIADATS